MLGSSIHGTGWLPRARNIEVAQVKQSKGIGSTLMVDPAPAWIVQKQRLQQQIAAKKADLSKLEAQLRDLESKHQ